jgi:hypothetical protein
MNPVKKRHPSIERVFGDTRHILSTSQTARQTIPCGHLFISFSRRDEYIYMFKQKHL